MNDEGKSEENMTSPNYEKDFYAWSLEQARLLKNKKLTHLDLKNLAEEIESLGKKDRRALKSHLIILLLHLLKIKVQKRKTNSWKQSISNSRNEIEFILEDSPSLRREIAFFIDEVYEKARKEAAEETRLSIEKFPKKCPWSVDEILGQE